MIDENSSFLASKQLEFNKTNLFFRAQPFKIAYDSIKVKNTGTTCIYFKWQKVFQPFNLQEKKSDGIEKFFCHYSDSKLFPGEEKEFTFSFFSEKNGVFSEYWELKTEPELKDLRIHLNGMTLLTVDRYSNDIANLGKDVMKKSEKTLLHEMVLDLIYNVKTPPPRTPDMYNPEHFKFYFISYNKEYNVYYSEFIMNQFLLFEKQLFQAITEQNDNFGEEDHYWNGSIDLLKKNINTNLKDPESKREFLFKLEVLINKAQKKPTETSIVGQFIKSSLNDLPMDIVEMALKVREELVLPPVNFDFLTRQGLTDQETNKYNNDLNKKKDEFFKKAKKKYKNAEEEQNELNEYKNRLSSNIRNCLLNKFSDLENIEFVRSIEEKVLNTNFITEDFIDRLARVKNFNHVKDILESKIVVIRVDLDYEIVTEPVKNEEGEVIDIAFKHIDFGRAKDIILPICVNQFLDNRAKLVILLASYGDKVGNFDERCSMDHFIKYLQRETTLDQQIILIKNEDLMNFQTKIENEEFKDGSTLVVENLNFNPEECGYEIDENGNQQNLKYYNKLKFTRLLSVGSIYVNDSYRSINSTNPSITSMQCDYKILGNFTYTQLQKLVTFYSIATKDFCMVIGSDKDDIYDSLLTINANLNYFKKIFLFGKLALHFICLVQEQYHFGDTIKLNPNYLPIMKFILVRAALNNIEIVLPQDIMLLNKSEYEKFSTVENYMKQIKTLKKRDKIAKDVYAMYAGTDELEQQEDYTKNVLNEEESEILKFYHTEAIEFEANSHLKNFVKLQNITDPQKKLNYDYEFADFLRSIYQKPLVRVKENDTKINLVTEDHVLVDFGPKSYLAFADFIGKHDNNVKCLLWIDNLSPSSIENLFDNYNTIMSELYTRKNFLKEKFKDMIADEEVKPSESDLKSRKNLFNIFLKGKNAYNCMKIGYKFIINENKQGEDEENQDDDALNMEMRNFVDFFLEEELDVILNILKGENVPGIIKYKV